MTSNTLTYFKLTGAALVWGGTWVAGKVLASNITPYSAAFLRFLFATVFMFLLVYKSTGKIPRCKKNELPPLIFMGLTGSFLYNILFFTGLKTIDAGRAALIIAATPAIIATSSAAIFKEKFTFLKITGFLTALLGVSTVLGNGNPFILFTQGIGSGDLSIIGCVFSWAAYSLTGKPIMEKTSPINAVFWTAFFGMTMLSIPALLNGLMTEVGVLSAKDMACILFLAFLGTGLAFSWYCEAIGKIGPSKTGVFINLVPVFAVILGALLLGEKIGTPLIIGGSLTVSGVCLVNRR